MKSWYKVLILGKYEVDDIDEEQKNRHVLSKRRVVPLPLMRADPRTDEHALFPKGAVVMALYPQTTCFYRAVVNRLPASAADPYEVLFEVSLVSMVLHLGLHSKKSYMLRKRRVILLPLMRADPRTDEHALFPKGAVVMALYPQTTCFYRAVVNRLLASAADPYEVLFE
ncbi:SAGA-associated factor 29-like protein, partial [Operophtera brumata]